MANITVTLELVKEIIFKLFSLVVVYLGWETKAHDEVIKEFSGCSLSRLFCCICLCIFSEVIHYHKYVFFTSPAFSPSADKVQRSYYSRSAS